MPRPPRPGVANIPQHIVQRGNDRQARFFDTVDYERYLIYLHQFALHFECAIHAYLLMTNHVHMLVTPAYVGGVSRMMHALGTHYVPYINGRYARIGTLWEGRHRTCLVDNEGYLLTCYRYIEQNPCRAHMVAAMDDFRWSSYHCNAHGSFDRVVTPHPTYLNLGSTVDVRRARYHEIANERLDDKDLMTFRVGLNRQKPLR